MSQAALFRGAGEDAHCFGKFMNGKGAVKEKDAAEIIKKNNGTSSPHTNTNMFHVTTTGYLNSSKNIESLFVNRSLNAQPLWDRQAAPMGRPKTIYY